MVNRRQSSVRALEVAGTGLDLDAACAIGSATCGELVQGFLDGRDFLITAPIDLYAKASVMATEGTTRVDVRGPCGNGPDAYPKVAAAVRKTLDEFGLRTTGARIEMDGRIPRGKGMASSSADIAAAIHATVEAVGMALPAHEMCRISVGVEPTDGVLYDGVVMLDQIRGEMIEVLGDPPPLAFIIVDTGGEVETTKFDRERARSAARRNESILLQALYLVRRGIELGDARSIAEGATLSARVNQEVLFKPEFDDVLRATAEVGALGVNCGHTGTVLGVLFDPRTTSCEQIVRRIECVVGAGQIIGVHRFVSGGSRIVRASRANVTVGQRGLIERYGQPVRRVRDAHGFVLEFNTPSAEPESPFGATVRRLFGHPDGSMTGEHPDPAEGQLPMQHARRPVAGEIWEMRVVVESESDRQVRYRAQAPAGMTRPMTRVELWSEFLEQFALEDGALAMRAQILFVDGGIVTYAPVLRTGARVLRRSSIPQFISLYCRVT